MKTYQQHGDGRRLPSLRGRPPVAFGRCRALRRMVAFCIMVIACDGESTAREMQVQLPGIIQRSLARNAKYYPPSRDHLRRAQGLFSEMTRMGADESRLREEFVQLGFELHTIDDGSGRPLRVASESTGHRQGRGVYAVRPSAVHGLVIQAPHGFFDRHTRALCTQVFLQGDFFAAAWSTSHRTQVDVAHEPKHFFQAFTLAMAASRQGSTVLQLHGFDQRKRSSVTARTADFIVANGTRLPRLSTRRTAHSLQAALPHLSVRLFPWSVQELGAITNTQARSLRSSVDDDFISLEMSSPARQQLLQTPDQLAAFAQALAQSVRQEPKQ